MQRGHRNMYYLTGLPGWMRFGYSPGWGGMPPGATYLTTGQWPTPQAQDYWQAMQSGQATYPQYGPTPPPLLPRVPATCGANDDSRAGIKSLKESG